MVVCFAYRYICNVKRNDMKNITKVNILAAQIRKANGTNRSQSMKQAWAIIISTPAASILTFTKKSNGTTVTRVVASNWQDFQPPVGGRSTNKPDQILFADLCKVAVGVPCIISTFSQNIVALAA